jgi:hypothetical protein
VLEAQPPAEALRAEQFGREFTLRLETGADRAAIERALRDAFDRVEAGNLDLRVGISRSERHRPSDQTRADDGYLTRHA